MPLSDFIDRLYRLRRDSPGGHERPHKPVLLLSVIDGIASGEIAGNQIVLSDSLIDRFKRYFAVVASHNDRPTIQNPFYYMSGERFWTLVPKEGHGPLYVPGNVKAPKSVEALRREADFATLDPELWALLRDRAARAEIRAALLARYFPDKQRDLAQPASEYTVATSSLKTDSVNEEEEPLPARSAAFRHFVREIYDYQCAACGLRIRIGEDLSFVDAAHIVPFSESHNDHPSNGLALCKNHHWAFDNFLLALDLNDRWVVSPCLHPSRSAGEKELLALANTRIVTQPAEGDFRPAEKHRRWRLDRLRSA